MALFFEYGNWKSVNNYNHLNKRLQSLWQGYKEELSESEEIELSEDAKDNHYQPFFKFDDNEIRANNYVGFIQNKDNVIEVYPKVFRNSFKDSSPTKEDKASMLRHIFYWFKYCRKWRFPFNIASLETINADEFPELIIYLFAKHFLETISHQPLSMYQNLEEALITPRGTINFTRYINKGLSYGNFHQVECDHEPFLFDNMANRIIKCCARLLLSQTKQADTITMLQEVTFILDEVEDLPCSIHDIDKVNINPFFEEYRFIMDSCRWILSQQLYSSDINDFLQWCLLFPMEYIFEDFFAGFLEQHLSKEWDVYPQKSNKSLAKDSNKHDVFRMKHDLFLTHKRTGKTIIIDTKYKLRDSKDNKKGIAQSDLYQVASYAFRQGCKDVFLVYPNLSDDRNNNSVNKFTITSEFSGKEIINVTALEIPFWSFKDFEGLEKNLIAFVREHIT